MTVLANEQVIDGRGLRRRTNLARWAQSGCSHQTHDAVGGYPPTPKSGKE
jgi:hypothetical protein